MNQEVQAQQNPVRMLFVNGATSSNKGSLAIVRCAQKALKECIPESHFGILLNPSSDPSRYKASDSEVVPISSKRQAVFILFRSFLWRFCQELFKKDWLNMEKRLSLLQYDVFIDVSGDCFNDNWGLRSLLFYLFPLFIGLILRKPLVIYGESVGPFTTWLGRSLAKFVLNRARLITVREEISQDLCHRLGIEAYLTAEPAFTLELSSNMEAEKQIDDFSQGDKIVGMSLAQEPLIISKRQSDPEKERVLNLYVETMTQVVDYLTESKRVRVVLLPHVCGEGVRDDRVIQSQVLSKIKAKDKVLNIVQDYEPEELKGIIASCWMFIGTRMHANIGALSSHVPAIAIGVEHKTRGIMRQLGMEEYTVDIYRISFDDMTSKINQIWDHRNQISQELEIRMQEIQKRALSTAELVSKVLSSSVPDKVPGQLHET